MPLNHIDPARYEAQLADKLGHFTEAFAPFGLPTPTVIRSAPLHYRLRAEFRMYHDDAGVHYAMFAADNPKLPVIIDSFPVTSQSICDLMGRLRDELMASQTLRHKLFQVDFLATLSGEVMATLIYRKPIGEDWEAAARELAARLDIQVIGRSRGIKKVIGRDWLLEGFELNGRQLVYQQIEGSFTQPNGEVNRQMLGWACQQAAGLGGDLIELYCGNGNFTVALAPLFEHVLATEVSKTSVRAAEYNFAANRLDNVTVIRLSSEEISAAMSGTRTFTRLQQVDLSQYRFSTIFLDPPRAGLDAQTLELAAGFDHILYISCNPQTLRDNVAALHASHHITAAAVFDQFPYTHHLESGLLLSRRQPDPTPEVHRTQ